jgi:SAM-dependent methyltransferase
MVMHADTQPSPAEAYESYFVPAIFEPLTAAVLGQVPPRQGERVLDVACGTGVVARHVAPLVGPEGAVVGIDLNPGMVAVAQRAVEADGAPIEFRQGDAQALELADGSFDRIFCQQGIQFLPDRDAGAREMWRVLADGGTAVVAVWQGIKRHTLYAAMAEIEAPHLASFGLPVTAADLEAPFSLGDTAELRALLEGAGFLDVSITQASIEARFATPDRFVERLEYAYAAVVPAFAENPAAFAAYLARIADETQTLVAQYRVGDHVVVPMHTHIAVARR